MKLLNLLILIAVSTKMAFAEDKPKKDVSCFKYPEFAKALKQDFSKNSLMYAFKGVQFHLSRNTYQMLNEADKKEIYASYVKTVCEIPVKK